MKAVMISIKPKWCELIASGKKTIEVRQTYPKKFLEEYHEKQSDFFRNRPSYKLAPFTCYIYCAYGNALADLSNCSCESIENDVKSGAIRRYALQEHKIMSPVISSCDYGNGKVIGEFVCDKIDKFVVGSLGCDDIQKLACLSYPQMIEYFYKPEELDGKTIKLGYAWHISNLVIYDKPKELREFWKADTCKHYDGGCDCWYELCGRAENNDCHCGHVRLIKPPQSWCYVEELK